MSERLTYSIGEAAKLLGCSRDFFDDHVRADLKLIHCGRLIRVSKVELEKWVEKNSSQVLA